MKIVIFALFWSTAAFANTDFWAPLDPPQVSCRIEARLDASASRITGSETIRFTNNTSRPIGRVAFKFDGEELKVRANGIAAARVAGVKNPALFEFAPELAPGASAELAADWSRSCEPVQDGHCLATSEWYPRLWWGYESLADYEAKVEAPAGLVVLIAGQRTNGVFKAPGARALGLAVARGMEMESAEGGGVTVTAIFTRKGSDCAHLVLKTATDAIGYYQGRFGFYPQNSLLIVPGADQPIGGCPVGSGLIAIHGEEHMREKPDDWWKWVTAHEIGHMYWSEHVLAQGPDWINWLLVGLGLHADQEYARARGINGGDLLKVYASGVKAGYDTTMDLTAKQLEAVQWDYNNIVMHGKSLAMEKALEAVIGAKTYDAAYRRCLREYSGKRLGWREFQKIAEQESGQDLEWFFEQWVRSPAFAAYEVAGQASSNGVSTVRIQKTGTMHLPVTVAAQFEDGTEQRAVTERLAEAETLRFRAASPLTNVVLEPDSSVILTGKGVNK